MKKIVENSKVKLNMDNVNSIEDGKAYDVSGLYNNDLENYFKELVNYGK